MFVARCITRRGARPRSSTCELMLFFFFSSLLTFVLALSPLLPSRFEIEIERAMSFKVKNASYGMGVTDHSMSIFIELKRKKMHRYVIFKVDETKMEVVVEKTGAPGESYDDFAASLPEDDCRYAVYDLDFVTEENCQKSKIFFIAWSPSISRIRAKMVYATSRGRFRHDLDGIHYEIQATDPTEMDLDVLRGRAN